MSKKNKQIKLEKADSHPQEIIQSLTDLGNPKKAKTNLRFFKTGKGQYGEGDTFIGCTMPEVRNVVKAHFQDISFDGIGELMTHSLHEVRMAGCLSLVEKYKKEKERESKKTIVDVYLKYRKGINNWDFVDVSAHHVLGAFAYEYNDQETIDQLVQFSQSTDLWEKRISVISTMYHIKRSSFDLSLKIIKTLLYDDHDLIHKATGWMLREIGNSDKPTLIKFLDQYYDTMPRTCLRYSIEKLDKDEKAHYMAKPKKKKD